MKISLENWLRNKLQENEEMQDYSVATDTVRCWIDEYEESRKIQSDTIKIKKFDSNGVEMKVGDIIQRVYKYEIRIKENTIYAHILDCSNFHLSVKDLGRDFTIINTGNNKH